MSFHEYSSSIMLPSVLTVSNNVVDAHFLSVSLEWNAQSTTPGKFSVTLSILLAWINLTRTCSNKAPSSVDLIHRGHSKISNNENITAGDLCCRVSCCRASNGRLSR